MGTPGALWCGWPLLCGGDDPDQPQGESGWRQCAESAGRARRRRRLCPQGRSSAKAPCRDPSMEEAAGELQGAGGGQPHTQPTLARREPGPAPRFSHSLPNAGLRSAWTGQAQLLPTALWGDKSPWQVRGLSPSRSISQGPSQARGAGRGHALLTAAKSQPQGWGLHTPLKTKAVGGGLGMGHEHPGRGRGSCRWRQPEVSDAARY